MKIEYNEKGSRITEAQLLLPWVDEITQAYNNFRKKSRLFL